MDLKAEIQVSEQFKKKREGNDLNPLALGFSIREDLHEKAHF